MDFFILNIQIALFVFLLFIAIRIVFPKRKKKSPSDVAHSNYKELVYYIISAGTIENLEKIRSRIDNFKSDHFQAVDANTLYSELDDLYNHFYDNMIMDGSFSVG